MTDQSPSADRRAQGSGVLDAKVSMLAKTAIVTYDQTKTTPDALVAATTDYGYPSQVVVQSGATTNLGAMP